MSNAKLEKLSVIEADEEVGSDEDEPITPKTTGNLDIQVY